MGNRCGVGTDILSGSIIPGHGSGSVQVWHGFMNLKTYGLYRCAHDENSNINTGCLLDYASVNSVELATPGLQNCDTGTFIYLLE